MSACRRCRAGGASNDTAIGHLAMRVPMLVTKSPCARPKTSAIQIQQQAVCRMDQHHSGCTVRSSLI